MAISSELISQINKLALKKKDGTITDEELKEQKKLREEYIEAFRGNMQSVLKNIDVVDSFKIATENNKIDDVTLKCKNTKGIKSIKMLEDNKEIEILYDYEIITKEEIIDKIAEKN